VLLAEARSLRLQLGSSYGDWLAGHAQVTRGWARRRNTFDSRIKVRINAWKEVKGIQRGGTCEYESSSGCGPRLPVLDGMPHRVAETFPGNIRSYTTRLPLTSLPCAEGSWMCGVRAHPPCAHGFGCASDVRTGRLSVWVAQRTLWCAHT
jgi:hypothetical protein